MQLLNQQLTPEYIWRSRNIILEMWDVIILERLAMLLTRNQSQVRGVETWGMTSGPMPFKLIPIR